jgi:hypothetical protein
METIKPFKPRSTYLLFSPLKPKVTFEDRAKSLKEPEDDPLIKPKVTISKTSLIHKYVPFKETRT